MGAGRWGPGDGGRIGEGIGPAAAIPEVVARDRPASKRLSASYAKASGNGKIANNSG
jgi:hypothetical protein